MYVDIDAHTVKSTGILNSKCRSDSLEKLSFKQKTYISKIEITHGTRASFN